MISLPDVTLIAISSIKIQETIDALLKCSSELKFGEIKFVSDKKPDNLPKGISFEKCDYIDNINYYNLTIFKKFHQYVDTSHCLLVQYHAYVLNPSVWDNDWLQYDYIGAPWAIRDDAYICHDTGEHVRVGNGGFSLRSRKLLEIPDIHDLPLLEEQGWYNEDGNICVYHRVKMLELGVKYAPVEVAAKFSWENPVKENFGVTPFGFHRNYPQFVTGGKNE